MASSSAKTQLSLRVPASVIASFDQIAAALQQDRTWVMLRAFRQYLDTEGADIVLEAAGFAALDGGEGADFDAVMSEADAIIAATRAWRGRAG